ncbi:MAG: restriction endonuclease subunit S [Gammaproteobacteria bacterium WSBS_2016_MAG_OTU1]
MVGRVVSFDENIDAVSSNFVARIRPRDGVSKRYFLYLLAAHYISGYSHQFIKQNTGIQNLDDTNLFRSDVWIPDLPTQRAIADFLDRETARLNSLIKKKQRLVDLLGEKRNVLITTAVTGNNPNTPEKSGSRNRRSVEGGKVSSLFQTVPDGWQRTPLHYLVDGPKNGAWGSEENEDDKNSICVRVADFDWSRLTLNLRNQTTRSFKMYQLRNLKLYPGDILIEKSGGGTKTPVGRVVSFDENIDAVSSNFVARIRPRDGVSKRHFLYLLAAHYISGYSHQFIKQNTGIQNLDDTNLFRSDVWIPDLPAQRAIADFLDRETTQIDKIIERTRISIDRLKEYRSALIHRRSHWSDKCLHLCKV